MICSDRQNPIAFFNEIREYYSDRLYETTNNYYSECGRFYYGDYIPLDVEIEEGMIPRIKKEELLTALSECVKGFDVIESEQEVLASRTLNDAFQLIIKKYYEKEPERQRLAELSRKKQARQEKDIEERKINGSNEWATSIRETALNYAKRTGLPYYSFDGQPHQNRFASYTNSFKHISGKDLEEGWLDDETVNSLILFIPGLSSNSSMVEKAATVYSFLDCYENRKDTLEWDHQWRKVVFFPTGECLPGEEVYTVCRAIRRELLFMAIKQEVPDLSFKVTYEHKKRGIITEIIQIKGVRYASTDTLSFMTDSIDVSIDFLNCVFFSPDPNIISNIRLANTNSKQRHTIIRRVFRNFAETRLKKSIVDALSFELGITGCPIGKTLLKRLQLNLIKCREILGERESITYRQNADMTMRTFDGRNTSVYRVMKSCININCDIVTYLFLHQKKSIHLNKKEEQFVFYPYSFYNNRGKKLLDGNLYSEKDHHYYRYRFLWHPGSTSMREGNVFFRVDNTKQDLKTLAWIEEMYLYFFGA